MAGTSLDDTPGDRLRQARIDAGYSSAAAGARAGGFHPQNLRDHEAGRRGISPGQAAAYERVFGRSATWVLYGDAGEDYGASAAVVGKVGAGGIIAAISDGVRENERAPLPPGSPRGVSALIVEGEAMWPAYAGGDVIYYGERTEKLDEIRDRLLDRECVLRTVDGRDMVRRLEAAGAPDRFTLTSYNAPPIRDVEVWWAAPILWVRKSGS